MNVVPKTGGNTHPGSVFFSGTGENLQSDNYTKSCAPARGADAADEGLRPQRRGRRTDHARIACGSSSTRARRAARA